MPIYEFRCNQCNEEVEAFFGFTEDHYLLCNCGNEMQKVFKAVGVIFNAPGFYKTGG